MSRPKLLDLFCCEGGASRGYQRAGFEVYGVDLFTKIKGGFSRHTVTLEQAIAAARDQAELMTLWRENKATWTAVHTDLAAQRKKALA